MVRSTRLAIAGAVVLCASFFALFVAMPKFTPFQFVHCTLATPAQAPLISSCFTSLNADYPLVFFLSVAGTVTMLVGLLGRGFVVSPVSVVGMIALEWGLAAMTSASLETESGVSVNPVIFSPYVAIGALVLCFQAYRRLHPRTTPSERLPPSPQT